MTIQMKAKELYLALMMFYLDIIATVLVYKDNRFLVSFFCWVYQYGCHAMP